MKLANANIVPGRVLNVENNQGVIKACASGLFSDVDSPDLLPPIYPWPMRGKNSFSKVKKDDEVWVIYFTNNPIELFYFRKDSLPQNSIINSDCQDIEVLAHLDSGLGSASLFYTNDKGWMIQNNDTFIQLDKEGNIILDKGDNHRVIEINDSGISLGSHGESDQPAVKGDNLADVLEDICGLLGAVQRQAALFPYTKAISTVIEARLPEIESKIDSILSNHVTLD